MKAVLCKQYGPPASLGVDEIEPPKMGKGDVRIKVHACGVNFPDTLIIQGKYQFKPEMPFAPGGEIAGEVIETGEKVQHLRKGDRVAAVILHGGYAEEAVVAANGVIPLPEGIDYQTAAAFPMAYGTSMHALKQRAQLQAGETLLVLGAAGGVGLAAVQIGKAMGARVIAAASSEEKLNLCKQHGADELIDYSDGELKDKVKKLTGGNGADVIYDPVGGDLFNQCMSAVNWNGRVLVIGFAGGEIPELAINRILLKGCAVVGVFWGQFAMREPDKNLENFAELLQWYQEAKIQPVVSQTYPLAKVPQAMEDMLARKAKGKLVIEVA